jgi:predicted ester cyclase
MRTEPEETGAKPAMKHGASSLRLEAFTRRYYALFNERRFDEAERLVDAHALFTYPSAHEHFIGRAGYRELVRCWVSGFPDARVSITAVHVRADTAQADWIAEGTHAGTLELPGLPPIPATGRQARLPMRETITIQHGLIVASRMQFDIGELRQALGI